MPLLHSRVSSSTYDRLLLKVRAKFAGWRMKTLSLSARALLIQTVASTIPAYVMQSAKLPCHTINTLEKMSRDFLWAADTIHRGMHHVAWAKVCQPKHKGGLGIRPLETSNSIALAEHCWWMLSNPTQVWSQVLLAKYGGLLDLQRLRHRASSSHPWRSIRKGWELLKSGLRWQLGDGSLCLFWIDNWVEEAPLASFSELELPISWLPTH